MIAGFFTSFDSDKNETHLGYDCKVDKAVFHSEGSEESSKSN
jgi:hypothetical protein